jgi:hypothetical protein
MPYKDPEKNRECQRRYKAKNKELLKQKNKEYRERNKEKCFERTKKCFDANPEMYIKTKRISVWKNYGIIHDDYNALYDKYLNTNNCEECGIQMCFGKGKDARCVDHDHETGMVRNIICRSCNSRRH